MPQRILGHQQLSAYPVQGTGCWSESLAQLRASRLSFGDACEHGEACRRPALRGALLPLAQPLPSGSRGGLQLATLSGPRGASFLPEALLPHPWLRCSGGPGAIESAGWAPWAASTLARKAVSLIVESGLCERGL